MLGKCSDFLIQSKSIDFFWNPEGHKLQVIVVHISTVGLHNERFPVHTSTLFTHLIIYIVILCSLSDLLISASICVFSSILHSHSNVPFCFTHSFVHPFICIYFTGGSDIFVHVSVYYILFVGGSGEWYLCAYNQPCVRPRLHKPNHQLAGQYCLLAFKSNILYDCTFKNNFWTCMFTPHCQLGLPTGMVAETMSLKDS